jgi:hypothetical protein
MSEALTISLAATAILAGVFVLPWPREVIDERTPGFRSFVSFAAGVSLAYVFIDLLPELGGLGDELLEEEAFALPFPEYLPYMVALFGFILFYGLERLVRWHRPEEPPPAPGREGHTARVNEGDHEEAWKEEEERTDYRIKLAGMAAYTGLILLLMTGGIREGSEEGLAVYVVAMLFHFTAMRHGLRYEFPDAYMRQGRWVMAGAAVAGAILGLFYELPLSLEVLLLGLLGGMLIMNTTVMELPSEKEGRFGVFALGGILYTVLLLLI